MRSRIMWIENKSAGGGLAGPVRIGRVWFSKTGRTLKYGRRTFRSLKGRGYLKDNFTRFPADFSWQRIRSKRQPRKLSIDVIEAQAIVLVDEYGTKRASLSCFGGDAGAGGATVVHLNDDNGCPSITLQVDDHGNPSICLFTRGNSPGVSMAVNNGHGSGLSIADSEGKPRITMGVPGPESDDPRTTSPEITVIDEHGRRAWSVFVGGHEIPGREEEVKRDEQE